MGVVIVCGECFFRVSCDVGWCDGGVICECYGGVCEFVVFVIGWCWEFFLFGDVVGFVKCEVGDLGE